VRGERRQEKSSKHAKSLKQLANFQKPDEKARCKERNLKKVSKIIEQYASHGKGPDYADSRMQNQRISIDTLSSSHASAQDATLLISNAAEQASVLTLEKSPA